MRLALITSSLILAVAMPAAAGPYAPQEYDFSGMPALDAQAFGVVESVREMSSGPEVTVLLDDGRQVVVVQNRTSVEPGERVRLARNGLGFSILNL